MSEDVGGIEYYIDVDASNLKSAIATVISATTKMQDEFEKIDKATKKNKSSFAELNSDYSKTKRSVLEFVAEQVKMGRSINENGEVITAHGVKARKLTEDLAKLSNEFKDNQSQARQVDAAFSVLTAETTRLDTAVEKVNNETARTSTVQNKAAASSKKLGSAMKNASTQTGGFGRKAGAASIQVQQFTGQISGGVNPMIAFSQQAADLGIVLGLPLLGSIVGIAAAVAVSLTPALDGGSDAVNELTDKLKGLKSEYVLLAKEQEFLTAVKAKDLKDDKNKIVQTDKQIKKTKELIATQKARRDSLAKGLAGVANVVVINKQIEESELRLKALESEKEGLKVKTGELTRQELSEIKKVEEITKALTQQLDIQRESILNGANAARRLELAFQMGLSSAEQLSEPFKDLIDQIERTEHAEQALADLKVHNAKEQAKLDKEIRDKAREEELANKKMIAEFDKLNADLKTGGMTELEKLQEDFEVKRELIAEHEAILLADKEASRGQELAIEEKHKNALAALDKDFADKKKKLEDAENAAKVNAVSSTFSALSSLMNTESKKLFEIGKAAALAGAIVDGIAGVQGAFKVGNKLGGPPLGAAYAAAAAIQAAVQVQNIAKQKVGGSSSAGAATSFSGGTPTVNTQQSGGDRNISIAGIDANSLITGGQLVDTLNKALGDGYSINFG